MFVIMDKKEEKYGIVGAQTDLFDSKGIRLTVGDLINVKSPCGNDYGTSFVCYQDGKFFVMGIASDCYEGVIHGWETTMNTKASDICEGTFDDKGLFVAFINDGLRTSPVITNYNSEQNLQYIFTFKDFTPNKDKQAIREQIKNIDESCVAIIDPIMFKSAKLVNKTTGKITDLMK